MHEVLITSPLSIHPVPPTAGSILYFKSEPAWSVKAGWQAGKLAGSISLTLDNTN